ncbi:hypothetical protein [Novosphingobium sp. Leaf2]|uniref:hypothetical protein n=1 Tax=Novosphingobium sp. Leaf2 TaxID=1735670 RepID=UPI0006FC960C|nr:hypothetical protein [Novosphingobium sp. Leaf2]KQM13035.1 hypothetical protein ASE49_13675 [Novosphingobium sp. Leaf2]
MTQSPASQPPALQGLVSNEDILIQSLPTVSRLALAYAPARARRPTLALLALDARLAHLLRQSREPMMAQLRLAWWRESLAQPAASWPDGEPLLAFLKSWNDAHAGLVPLVDGWEALTGAAPLPGSAMETMAEGRAHAFATLADVLDRSAERDVAALTARSWALSDLAMRLGHAEERQTAQGLAHAARRGGMRLSRPLRPLLVLEGLAARRLAKGQDAAATSPAAVLKAMRLGLLGF